MMLHWLAGYSFVRLFSIASGIFLCAVMGFHLVNGQTGKNRLPLQVTLLGMLSGACMAVSSLLRGKPRWADFDDNIGMIGGVTVIIWGVLLMRHHLMPHNKSSTPIEPIVSSDKVWPPPPTSPGGG